MMQGLGAKKNEHLSKMDRVTEELPQLSNEMQLSIMKKVKSGELSIEDALQQAERERKRLLQQMDQAEEVGDEEVGDEEVHQPIQYNFSVHKHGRYRWQKRVLQLDFKTKMVCSIEKGIINRRLPFSRVKGCDDGAGSRFTISYRDHHDYELEATSLEDKYKIMQLVNQIIYGNIYSPPAEETSEARPQSVTPSKCIQQGVLLVHRGGLASFKWVKYEAQLHPGQLILLPAGHPAALPPPSEYTPFFNNSKVIHLSDGDTRVERSHSLDTFTLITHKNEYQFRVPITPISAGPLAIVQTRDAWVKAIDRLCKDWKRKSQFLSTQGSPAALGPRQGDPGLSEPGDAPPADYGGAGLGAEAGSGVLLAACTQSGKGEDSPAAQDAPVVMQGSVSSPASPETEAGPAHPDPEPDPASQGVRETPPASHQPVSDPPAAPISPISSPTSPSSLLTPPKQTPAPQSPLPTSHTPSSTSPSSSASSPRPTPARRCPLPPSPAPPPAGPARSTVSQRGPAPPEAPGGQSEAEAAPPRVYIPAPPPLPFRSRVRAPAPTTKAFHWDLVGYDKINKSFWTRRTSRKIELDKARLHEEFAIQHSGKFGAKEPATVQEILLNAKIAHNFNIFLKSFPVQPEELKDKLFIVFEADGGLSDEQITSLRRYVPTPDDVEMYKSHKGPVAELHVVDRYMMEMCNLPYLSRRLDLLLTLRELPLSMKDLQPLVDQETRMCVDLLGSGSFVSVLENLLAIGNFLNQNAGKDAAKGFRLSSLSKLSQLRGRDRSFTLLHALVEQVMVRDPAALTLLHELAEFETVPGASIKGLSAEVDVLKNELQKVVHYRKINKKGNNSNQHQKFSKDLKMAIEKYKTDISGLSKKCDDMEKLYSDILVKFGEPLDQDSQELFGCISQFLHDFEKIHSEFQ